METDASSTVRRDAFAAALALLLLGLLWVVLRLYWQGALLLAAGAALGYLGWYRIRSHAAHPDTPAAPSPAREEAGAASEDGTGPKGGKDARPSDKGKGGKKRGRKRKR